MNVFFPNREPMEVHNDNINDAMQRLMRQHKQLIITDEPTIYTFVGFDEVNEEPIYGHCNDTDMEAIANACLKKPEARQYSATKEFPWPGEGKDFFTIHGVFRGHVSCVENDGMTYYDLRDES